MKDQSSTATPKTGRNVSERTRYLVKLSLLSALAYVIMFLEFPLPFCPPFLKLDFSDIPAVIATFSMGITAGVVVEFIKNLLHFVTKSSTMGVGEIANFVVGVVFLCPIWLLCRKNKRPANIILGFVAATVFMTIVTAFANYFVLLPAYSVIYGAPISAFVEMTKAVNGLVTDVKSLIMFAFVPFNLFKGIVVSCLGYALYRLLKRLL